MEWFNLRLNGMVYHVIFIPLLNRLVDIDYPYISDYPSYCIVNLGALAQYGLWRLGAVVVLLSLSQRCLIVAANPWVIKFSLNKTLVIYHGIFC